MMNILFALMLLAGILFSAFRADPAIALDAMLAGTGEALTLSLSLAGGYMFFMGLMNIAKEAGLIDRLSRLVRRRLAPLFPGAENALAPIALNLAANFFGMGGAAMPFGIAAMKELRLNALREGIGEGTASDAMCMFIALNASAIELLPTGVIALRAAAGSADAYAVAVPTFLASVLSFFSAIVFTKLLCRAFPAEKRRQGGKKAVVRP